MCSAPYVTPNCFLIAAICKKFEEQRPILFCNCSNDLTMSPSNSWWITLSLFSKPWIQFTWLKKVHSLLLLWVLILLVIFFFFSVYQSFWVHFIHSFFFISNHSIFVVGKGKRSRGTWELEGFCCFFVFFSKPRQFVSLSCFNHSTKSKKVFWEVKTFCFFCVGQQLFFNPRWVFFTIWI